MGPIIYAPLPQEPFSEAKCALAFSGGHVTVDGRNVFKAAVNIWAFNMTLLAVPGVPLLKSAVDRLQAHYFASPAPLPLDIVAAVTDGAAAAKGISERALRVASPPELLFAFIAAVHKDLATDDDARLSKWKDAMLTCPCAFVQVQASAELQLMALQGREDLAKNFETMRYTSVQKMFDVQSVAERIEASSGAANVERVAAHYQEIRFADGAGEKITKEFVDCSMTVLRRLMALPRCANMVMALCDEGLANPLDSVYKLNKIVSKASTPDKIEWSLELLIDLWRSGALKSDQLGFRHLAGNITGSGGKGIVDLMVFKRELLQHLIGKFADGRKFHPDYKARRRLR